MVSLFGWGSSSNSDSNAPNPQETSSQSPSQTQLPQSVPSPSESSQLAQQSTPPNNRNLKLFLGGVAFFSLSVWVTRRASIKKRLDCIPPFYSSSLYFQPKVNGAGEAFEALSLASLNVFSFGMMTTGAAMYALDINGLDDARRFMRVAMSGGIDESGKSDEQLEQEVTEWVTNLLGDRFTKQLEKERAKKQQQPVAGEKSE
ncbi:hypothetical protein N7513_006098 [Penicillium frequentans]|uniref:Altered inheritance of mitochondria protein 11 n=1 Tax=Penicillium frequentans TaxID=3151616 RepID=A0AAD6CVP4_9EURO|nr:hypothetical protein N7494_007625 [Penicillium glabrum]KAJ5548864.1 hypothetical protein N7513_006098 [Penicillium glabrum]